MANISTLNRIFLCSPYITQTIAQRIDSGRQWLQTQLVRAFGLLISAVFWVSVLLLFPSASSAQTVSSDASMINSLSNSPMSEPETVQTITDSADIPADKVDQFAQAYLQVLQLLSDREPELPAAETSTEALKIQQSIEADAIATIKDAGLTLPEYMQILTLASQDEAFQDKVLGRMDESTDER